MYFYPDMNLKSLEQLLYPSIKHIISKDPMFVLVRKTIFNRTTRNQPFSASSRSFIKK